MLNKKTHFIGKNRKKRIHTVFEKRNTVTLH